MACDSDDAAEPQDNAAKLPDTVTRISADELSSLEAKTTGLTVLDVRTAHEFSEGHIPGAKNIDIQKASFDEQASRLDSKQTYVIHCSAGSPGGRSTRAAQKLAALGFEHVYHLDGGYLAWEKAQTSAAQSIDTDKGHNMQGKPHYLEIVSPDVQAICSLYEQSLGIEFEQPAKDVGGARVASLPDGTLLGVRGPLREDEQPVVRIYSRVKELSAAIEAARKAGAQVALEEMPLGERGRIGIVILGGIEHGYWQPAS